MLSSLPVYSAISSRRALYATPRTRSMLWYRLNEAHLMATTPGVSATAFQYSYDSRRPPQAVCK